VRPRVRPARGGGRHAQRAVALHAVVARLRRSSMARPRKTRRWYAGGTPSRSAISSLMADTESAGQARRHRLCPASERTKMGMLRGGSAVPAPSARRAWQGSSGRAAMPPAAHRKI